MAAAALFVAIAFLAGPATTATANTPCEIGYGGPHPLPAAGCLQLTMRPPTLADLTRVAEEWQVPENATIKVKPEPSLRFWGRYVTVTFRWTSA